VYCPDRLVNRVMGGWPPMGVWGHGDITELQQRLDDVDDAITGVEAREANIRTGYIYVISNIGAFGPDVVKIGLTRRLDPHDRIRELGDASVPFRFDTHALVVATTPSPSRPACTRSSPTVGSTRSTTAASSSAPPPPRYATRSPGSPASISSSSTKHPKPSNGGPATQLLRNVQFAATLDLSSPKAPSMTE
jgi:hypothetical protein